MGIHGNSTCLLNYDGATGYLVGEENKGLAAMFIMMNAARLGVGMQGLAQGEVARQNAVAYAKDRRQGRALNPAARDEGAKADTLFVHPDVRRMLMEGKANMEGARALILYGALLVDLARKAQTEEERETANDLVSLLTPVIKGYLTDIGFETAVNAQQIYGGHGYIREWGMEQFVRDARINMIYEGANGVQALDLVGRKLAQNGGRAVQAFFKLIAQEVADGRAAGDERVAQVATALERGSGDLQAATVWLMQNAPANPDNVGAASYPYMQLMGAVTLGLMWLRMARASAEALAGGAADADFHEAKLVTARFYAERIMPGTNAHRRRIEGGAESLMALPADAF